MDTRRIPLSAGVSSTNEEFIKRTQFYMCRLQVRNLLSVAKSLPANYDGRSQLMHCIRRLKSECEYRAYYDIYPAKRNTLLADNRYQGNADKLLFLTDDKLEYNSMHQQQNMPKNCHNGTVNPPPQTHPSPNPGIPSDCESFEKPQINQPRVKDTNTNNKLAGQPRVKDTNTINKHAGTRRWIPANRTGDTHIKERVVASSVPISSIHILEYNQQAEQCDVSIRTPESDSVCTHNKPAAVCGWAPSNDADDTFITEGVVTSPVPECPNVSFDSDQQDEQQTYEEPLRPSQPDFVFEFHRPGSDGDTDGDRSLLAEDIGSFCSVENDATETDIGSFGFFGNVATETDTARSWRHSQTNHLSLNEVS